MPQNVGAPDYTRQIEIIDPENIWGARTPSGNAELAARLGSIVNFDRRGQLFYMEDFSNGVSVWNTDTDGTGAAVAASTTYWKSKGKSIKLTAGSDSSMYARIQHVLIHPQATGIGVEFAFCPNADVDVIELVVRLYDGTTLRYIRARWDQTNKNLDIWDNTDAWVNIDPTPKVAVHTHLFHVLKIVGSVSTGKYLRLLLDNEEHDISAYTFASEVSTTGPYIDLRIWNRGTSGANAVCYIDNVIVTLEEAPNLPPK